MFMKPAKPQVPVDMSSLRDNVFTFPPLDVTPWLFQFNQINVSLFLQQQLPDMPFDQASLKSGWSQSGSKQETRQHGLPINDTGYYPETQNTDNSLSLTTGDDQPMTGNRTSRSSALPYVSPYLPSTGPSAVPLSSDANALAASEPLDRSYWGLVPPGPAALSPFAQGGDPMWNDTNQSASPSLLEYGNYSLGVHASSVPQTVFRPGEVLHNLPLAPSMERESRASSNLYTSDLLEAMALNDDPDQSSWSLPSETQSEYDGPRCIEMPESDSTNSTWAEPEPIDGTTATPGMLKVWHTPSPSSSCDSIHTSFLVDPDHPLPSIEPVPSQATKSTGSSRRSRRLLPDRGHRSATPRRQSTARSDPPSPPPRRLTRLRPKPKQTSTQSASSPPPPSLEASQSQFPLGPAHPVRSPRVSANEELDLTNRVSKDEFLVRQKQLGMTYKEIRRMGGFVEAESTLRGRYRTLTKCREARVRRPEWSEKDLHLLTLAVHTLSSTPHPDLNPSKVPWKRVAEYIVAHGGSYHFGNSTCRKRWDELVREGAHRVYLRAQGRGQGQGQGQGQGGFLGGGGDGIFECEGLES